MKPNKYMPSRKPVIIALVVIAVLAAAILIFVHYTSDNSIVAPQTKPITSESALNDAARQLDDEEAVFTKEIAEDEAILDANIE